MQWTKKKNSRRWFLNFMIKTIIRNVWSTDLLYLWRQISSIFWFIEKNSNCVMILFKIKISSKRQIIFFDLYPYVISKMQPCMICYSARKQFYWICNKSSNQWLIHLLNNFEEVFFFSSERVDKTHREEIFLFSEGRKKKLTK